MKNEAHFDFAAKRIIERYTATTLVRDIPKREFNNEDDSLFHLLLLGRVLHPSSLADIVIEMDAAASSLKDFINALKSRINYFESAAGINAACVRLRVYW